MPTATDYILGDSGFDPDIIRRGKVESVEISMVPASGLSTPVSKVFFNEKGLRSRSEIAGRTRNHSPLLLSPMLIMEKFTIYNYAANDQCITEEEYETASGEKLGQTQHTYKVGLLLTSIRKKTSPSGDTVILEETKYTYDSSGQLIAIERQFNEAERSIMKTIFRRQGAYVSRKVVTTIFKGKEENFEELNEETSFFYNDSNQLIEAHTKSNIEEQFIDRFTYDTSMDKNIKMQERYHNHRLEKCITYLYNEDGLIRKQIHELENFRAETQFNYRKKE